MIVFDAEFKTREVALQDRAGDETGQGTVHAPWPVLR